MSASATAPTPREAKEKEARSTSDSEASQPETPCANRFEFGVVVPMQEQSVQTVADAQLSRWVLLVGAPHRLLTDQGTQVELAVVQNLCTISAFDNVPTTAYYPGNGAGERLNRMRERGR